MLQRVESHIDAMLSFSERRKEVRFVGQIPIDLKEGTGVTHDFSASGVYFLTDQSLNPRQPIEFVMNLEHSGLGSLVRVRCLGDIVRVEPMRKKTGVAVAISSFRFEGHRHSSSEPQRSGR